MSEQNTYWRTYARIDLDAIEKNFKTLKSALQEGGKTMAVVKANGYGHGALRVAKRLEDQCDYFAVACCEEALELRAGGIQKPILILSYSHPSQYKMLVQNDISLTLFNADEARLLSETALSLKTRAKVHIAVDTGMGRIGVTPDESGASIVEEIAALKGIFPEGIFSHYASADEKDKSDADRQTALFDSFLQRLEKKNIFFPLKHICNSAASMEMEKKYDLCRLGIALYGIYPSEEVDRTKLKLIPAMEVISHVVHVKEVPKGFSLGYGHIYTADKPTRIATVAIGYADGFPRDMTEKGYVLIHGKKAPVVGKVCMDQIMVDINSIPDVKVGDEVTVLGKNGEEEISADTFGSLCHSFSYEVVCSFSSRVIRLWQD